MLCPADREAADVHLTTDSRPTTLVYLVRHAHADWHTDDARPLSARGRASSARLAVLLETCPITAIYSSPSRRALETIAPLAERRHLEPVVVHDLRERELSAPSAADFETAVAASWRDPARPATGGESNDAAQGRGIAIVRRVLETHQGESVVISTHGSLLSLIVRGFDASFGYDFWRSLTFPDVYELAFSGQALVSVRRVWQPEES